MFLFLYHTSFTFMSFLNSSFNAGWTSYPPLSTSFLTLTPSSTGHIILGLQTLVYPHVLHLLACGQQFKSEMLLSEIKGYPIMSFPFLD